MLNNLLNKEIGVVQKHKTFFIVPAIIVGIALIFGVIYGFVYGSPLNLSMDFTGGYTLSLQLGGSLTDDTKDAYYDQIEEIAESLTDDDGNLYGLTISSMQIQGEGSEAAILVKYKSVDIPDGEDDTEYMEELNDDFVDALGALFAYNPNEVTTTTTGYKVTYSTPIYDGVLAIMNSNLSEVEEIGFVSASYDGDDKSTILIEATNISEDYIGEVNIAVIINDKYSGFAVTNDSVTAVVSLELLVNAILAISLALVLMLVYIAFRFEVSSGVAAVSALMHDVLIMMSFMTIFHIELGSTFIAALITILGYSINNTIIVFDRIRENTKFSDVAKRNPIATANKSVQETLLRSLNTTITTILPISMIAIIGSSSIQIFALPIMIGLLAGTYSSICISPSIWALWKSKLIKDQKQHGHTPRQVAAKPQQEQ